MAKWVDYSVWLVLLDHDGVDQSEGWEETNHKSEKSSSRILKYNSNKNHRSLWNFLLKQIRCLEKLTSHRNRNRRGPSQRTIHNLYLQRLSDGPAVTSTCCFPKRIQVWLPAPRTICTSVQGIWRPRLTSMRSKHAWPLWALSMHVVHVIDMQAKTFTHEIEWIIT